MVNLSPVVGEFVGTFVLIVLGNGVVAGALLNRSKAQNAGWISITAGWAVAVALGVPLGLLMGRFRWFENITDPYVSFLYALPHVCFVPLMVVWLGFGFKFGLAYVVLSSADEARLSSHKPPSGRFDCADAPPAAGRLLALPDHPQAARSQSAFARTEPHPGATG